MAIGRLYLVRHGETDWNLASRIQGHRSTGLNETGLRQAEALARFFAPLPLAEIWSSDLPRALQTAERIAAPHGMAVRTLEALRERCLGPLEGMTRDEALLRYKDLPWQDIPGVEEDRDMMARLRPLLYEAGGLAGEVVMVTHGGVQNVLLRNIFGFPAGRRSIRTDNGLIIALEPGGGTWRIEGIYGHAVLERFCY